MSTGGSRSVQFWTSVAGGGPPLSRRAVDEPTLELLRKVDGRTLRRPLPVVVESDEEDYIARTPDLPQLYGTGVSGEEAVEMLAREIASMWRDLVDDSDLTEEWQGVRDLLADLLNAEQ